MWPNWLNVLRSFHKNFGLWPKKNRSRLRLCKRAFVRCSGLTSSICFSRCRSSCACKTITRGWRRNAGMRCRSWQSSNRRTRGVWKTRWSTRANQCCNNTARHASDFMTGLRLSLRSVCRLLVRGCKFRFVEAFYRKYVVIRKEMRCCSCSLT